MDSVKALIEKYGLVLPDNGIGKVNNQTLQQIHDDLLQKGQKSTNESLISGATFEEISITDLQKTIGKTDKEDAKTVYQGLLGGSRKHLGSLVKEMKTRGVEYSPQLLSQEEYDRIIGG
ncbi:MAG: DUF2202 domain-containing protein [Methanotrichaceae archaeon]|nr:DUF2202 domain-containing protein [Methanotrichaceae archaeon]